MEEEMLSFGEPEGLPEVEAGQDTPEYYRGKLSEVLEMLKAGDMEQAVATIEQCLAESDMAEEESENMLRFE
jgi:hypothetical protein